MDTMGTILFIWDINRQRKLLAQLHSFIRMMNEDSLFLYKYATSHNINEEEVDEDDDPVPVLSTYPLLSLCLIYVVGV